MKSVEDVITFNLNGQRSFYDQYFNSCGRPKSAPPISALARAALLVPSHADVTFIYI